MGVNEDPVTGSAHCCLAPYWGQKLGRDTLLGYQASKRGGLVRVQLNGERVLLGGQAVTVMKGELL
nr:PhzF family phenazine biosynthesis protein [Dictyobacter arantiisoli]